LLSLDVTEEVFSDVSVGCEYSSISACVDTPDPDRIVRIAGVQEGTIR